MPSAYEVLANTTALPPATNDAATIQLDDLDKAIIVLSAVIFLVIVLICMVCVLNPKCYLHNKCPCTYEKKEEDYGWREPQPMYGSIPISSTPETLRKAYNITPGRKSPTPSIMHQTGPPRESSEHSDWSDISMPEVIELKQMKKENNSNHKRKSSRTSDYSSASSAASSSFLESRLAYGFNFDRSANKFHIRVIQLGNFSVTGPEGATAPYVKIRVYKAPKHFFTFKLKTAKDLVLSNLAAEFQTKIQRKSDNPLFNEAFTLKIDETDMSAYFVKFLICDFDKFSRHVVIGEVSANLSKLELPTGDEVLFNDQLTLHVDENLGEIHVALMYLPTAEKMSVVVLNARALKPLEGPKRNTETFVKITLMFDGRPLKKARTAARTNDLNPVFNETFVFDVPAYQLDKVYFGITVMGVDKEKEEGRHLLGRLYIGVNFDADIREQWLEMVNNARKQVACWHKLQS